jgi:alkylhydroperoxidase/carboxymuconolactone decarboxylase family protein YurZ
MDQQLPELLGPMAPPLAQLDSLPGINALTARAMLAEMGRDMPRVGAASRLTDEMGKDASPVPADMNKDAYGAQVRARLVGRDVIPPPSGYQLFTPVIDTFLKEYLFADIFARDTLDYQSRELATIAALASMTGTASQLQFHLGAAMNTGLSEAQMKDFIAVLKSKVGTQEAESADEILGKVLRNRAQ